VLKIPIEFFPTLDKMSLFALQLLGSYQICLDEQVIAAVESDKARALLAYLALEKDRHHSREKLVGLFWPEKDEAHARDSLSQALSHLRKILGDRLMNKASNTGDDSQPGIPFLIVTPKEIQFNPHKEFQTDVGDFLSLIAACKTHEHPENMVCDECLNRYQKVANIYRGNFLEDFYLPKCIAFEEWATIWREKLRLSIMESFEYLVEAMERRSDLEKALEYSRRMVELDELSESGCLHIMRLLALLNRKNEALAEYVQFQQTLAMEVGVEPGSETKTLYQIIKNEQAGSLIGNLPADLTPFIGRRRELDKLWTMLRNPEIRLICILGMGGCGKTRLAIEAVRRQCYQFIDGIYFIPLSAFTKGSSLVAVITEGLGLIVGSGGEPKKQLLDYLRNKNIFLLLDSFETAIDQVALLTELLSTAPMVKILVTSRVRLNISGENAFPLEGMHYPSADAEEELSEYGSVKLFIEMGRLVKPGYMPDNLDSVAEICRLLEGIPLSVVLASSWLDMLSTEEIAVEIGKSLDFLSTKWNDVPERQQSLRATFEYSWNLLNTDEQIVLMKLAVFLNPFTIQAAFEVAGASLQILHELVGKSLLVSRLDGSYQMHDIVRQYSLQKLHMSAEGLEIATRQKHGEYFIHQIASWSKVFKGAQQSTLLNEADKVAEDVIAAWEWAAKKATLKQISLASEGLLLYYFLRYRFHEGAYACKLALENIRLSPMSAGRTGLEGWILIWQASFNRQLGNMDIARDLVKNSLELLLQAQADGQDTRLGQALVWREKVWLTNSLQESLDYSTRCAGLYRDLGESWRNAEIVAFTGELYTRLGDRVLALEMAKQAVTLSQLAGEPRLLARTLNSLANVNLVSWKWEDGITIMEKAANFYRTAGDMGSLSQADVQMGIALLGVGRFSEAIVMLETGLKKLNQLGDRFYTVHTISYLGHCRMQLGQFSLAGLTIQKALDVAQRDGYQREEMQCLANLGMLELQVGDTSRAYELLQHSVDGFRQMKFTGELAMALGGLALVYHRIGQEKFALETLQKVLQIAGSTYNRYILLTLPSALVVFLIEIEKWKWAVKAYFAVLTDPIVANSRYFSIMVGDRINLARHQLTDEARRSAEVCGKEGDLFEIFGRLAKEIESWDTVDGHHTELRISGKTPSS
jgi:DNA-binding SARP family transcriptional activator/predicted ATPase